MVANSVEEESFRWLVCSKNQGEKFDFQKKNMRDPEHEGHNHLDGGVADTSLR